MNEKGRSILKYGLGTVGLLATAYFGGIALAQEGVIDSPANPNRIAITCPDPNYPQAVTLQCRYQTGAPANIFPFLETCNPNGTGGKPLWVRFTGSNGQTYHVKIQSQGNTGWPLDKWSNLKSIVAENMFASGPVSCRDPNPNYAWGTVGMSDGSNQVIYNPGISSNGVEWPPESEPQDCGGTYNGRFNSGCGQGPTLTPTPQQTALATATPPGGESRRSFLPRIEYGIVDSTPIPTNTRKPDEPTPTATRTPTNTQSPTFTPTVEPTLTPAPTATQFPDGLTFYTDKENNAFLAEYPIVFVDGKPLWMSVYPVECTPFSQNEPTDPLNYGCYYGSYRIDLGTPTIFEGAALHPLTTAIFISETGTKSCAWVPYFPKILGDFQTPPYYRADFSVLQDPNFPEISVPKDGQYTMLCPDNLEFPPPPSRNKERIIADLSRQNPMLSRGQGRNR